MSRNYLTPLYLYSSSSDSVPVNLKSNPEFFSNKETPVSNSYEYPSYTKEQNDHLRLIVEKVFTQDDYNTFPRRPSGALRHDDILKLITRRVLESTSEFSSEAIKDHITCHLMHLFKNTPDTPPNRWMEKGEKDPFADYTQHQRKDLAAGFLTDDELANQAFMNYNRQLTVEELIAGNQLSTIALMTGVKERIRWLSRMLIKAEQERDEAIKQRDSVIEKHSNTI